MSEEIQEIQEKIITDKALSSILTQTFTLINEELNSKKIQLSINKKNNHWWVGYNTEIIATDSETPTINEEDNTWVVGVTTTDIKDDNFEYCIENINGYWFIGNDTGLVSKGKYLKSIEKDENDNFVAISSDGTSTIIGHLDFDVSVDLLSENGFGNMRYYEGKFQYYYNNKWTDIVLDIKNNILTSAPYSMVEFDGYYDDDLGYNVITFTEPSDTVVDGQTVCFVEKVIIVRKKDSIPQSTTDGDEVMTIHRRDFGKYKNTPYVDTECNAQEGDVWYYRAFPVSTMGIMNELEESNVIRVGLKIYGFRIDQNESDPDSMITYIEKNKNYSPAYMDFSTDTFNYGDWEDIWFIKNLKPCMLKYDGTVDYELDKNDYTQKVNGSGESDVSNSSYEGNAMVGIPKVYWKIVDNGDNTSDVYFCKCKIDNDYHCWSHMDCNGNEIDYCYLPIYLGSNHNSKLRSLSGQSPLTKISTETEISYALANNINSNVMWNIETYSDRILLTLLLMLIGRTTKSEKFGYGNISSSMINTGTMDNKGIFWGSTDKSKGVKVFGVENFWGCLWRRTIGYVTSSGVQKAKLTYDTSDGSTIVGYNQTGEGYAYVTTNGISSTAYIKQIDFSNVLFVKDIGGSSTTYFTDYMYPDDGCVVFGGSYTNGVKSGIFARCFGYDVSGSTNTNFGVSLSCKPLANN